MREARIEEMRDPSKITEISREHEVYIMAFIDDLAEKAKLVNKNVGAVYSKGGAAYAFPSMECFRRAKKSRDRTALEEFSKKLVGEGEALGMALVASVKGEPDKQEEELKQKFTEHVQFLS